MTGPAPVVGQEGQEVELLGGQGHRFAVDPWPPAGRRRLRSGPAVRTAVAVAPVPSGAAQDGLDPGHQLAGENGLVT